MQEKLFGPTSSLWMLTFIWSCAEASWLGRLRGAQVQTDDGLVTVHLDKRAPAITVSYSLP